VGGGKSKAKKPEDSVSLLPKANLWEGSRKNNTHGRKETQKKRRVGGPAAPAPHDLLRKVPGGEKGIWIRGFSRFKKRGGGGGVVPKRKKKTRTKGSKRKSPGPIIYWGK